MSKSNAGIGCLDRHEVFRAVGIKTSLCFVLALTQGRLARALSSLAEITASVVHQIHTLIVDASIAFFGYCRPIVVVGVVSLRRITPMSGEERIAQKNA